MIAGRTVIHHDGKYVHVGDFKSALCDPKFVEHLLAVMKVGHDRGKSPEEIIAVVVAAALFEIAGELQSQNN